uniref:Ig-like domain-containing protein n=1 Tax=Macrostomum lignano TaxID=282301 RepID=A0A1I8FJD9_9PLAT
RCRNGRVLLYRVANLGTNQNCNRSGHVTKPVTSSVANHQNRGFAKKHLANSQSQYQRAARVVAMHIGGAGLTAATLLTGLMVAAAAQLPAVFVLEQSPADKVLLKGSNVTFFCHYQKQQQAFVNSTPLDQVRLLFNQDPSDSTKMTCGAILALLLFILPNVSVSRHSGWYRCGCRDSGGRPLVMSEATQLTVGFPTAVDFFWQDRRYATLVVRPSLPAIANSTGVPPSLGGRLTLAVGVLQ